MPSALDSPGHDPLIGQIIFDYRIVSSIGGGRMGVDGKADETRLDRPVALKSLPEDLAHDSQALEHFRGKAKAGSALNHPNIGTIHDVGEDADGTFIVITANSRTSSPIIASRKSNSSTWSKGEHNSEI